ncbi:MAG: hypothetical protein ACYCDN_00735 [Schaalia turicensis]
MPATTPGYKLPYPLATDRVSDYPATARANATACEASFAPVSPSSGRLGNPPAGKPLHVVAWSAAVSTNQYGQAVLDLPDGVAGLKDICVTCARFSTEDGNAYNEVATVTGIDPVDRPIITITRAGVRAAHLSTIVMIVGVGWKK